MISKKETGLFYESICLEILKKKGYDILFQNLYLSKKEVDVVVIKDNILYFMEIRHTKILFNQRLSHRKLLNLEFAANLFMEKYEHLLKDIKGYAISCMFISDWAKFNNDQISLHCYHNKKYAYVFYDNLSIG